jgi:hypothetical protein
VTKTKDFLKPKVRPYMDRKMDTVPIHQRFLIVCEGKETESNYFERFRAPGIVVDIDPLGQDTIRVVQRTIALSEEGDYDQLWCVFDKDDFPKKNFNGAIELARQNGIQIAYSNQCFEIWYVLHFSYMHTAITRDQYYDILGKRLGHEYKKNSVEIFDEFINRQETAIRNAKRLLNNYDPHQPADDDPSTTIHLLVEQLLIHSKPFGCKKENKPTPNF